MQCIGVTVGSDHAVSKSHSTWQSTVAAEWICRQGRVLEWIWQERIGIRRVEPGRTRQTCLPRRWREAEPAAVSVQDRVDTNVDCRGFVKQKVEAQLELESMGYSGLVKQELSAEEPLG
eukprot:5626672-Amphidinium_carterae.3